MIISFCEDVNKVNSIKINNEKIGLYPRYISDKGSVYFDRYSHDETQINIFCMKLINDIIKNNKISNFEDYYDTDNLYNQNNTSVFDIEKQIYYRLFKFISLCRNRSPRENMVYLLKMNNIESKEVLNPAQLTNLLIRTFNLEKIYVKPGMKQITTSRSDTYSYFYNYILMGYDIKKEPRLELCNNGELSWSNSSNITEEEEKTKEELYLLKKYIPLKELNTFMKK